MTPVTVTALVDTGASTSGITKSVAEQLDLAPVGKRPLLSARAIVQVERYLFRIGIESPSDSAAPAFPFVFDVTLGFELGGDLRRRSGHGRVERMRFFDRSHGTMPIGFRLGEFRKHSIAKTLRRSS